MAASNGTLLGRRAELAAVDAALERTRAPPRRRARLLRRGRDRQDAAARRAGGARRRGPGALVLSGRASELERELPFGVWEDALAEHAEFLGVDRLERLVGDQLPELAAVLPAVGRVPAGLQDERYRTHRAVRALLEALAQRQPIVRRARRPALGRRRLAGARRAPAAAAAARAGGARAGLPAGAGPAAAGDRAGHRRARRRGDRARARRAVVRRRRDAARRRRSPAPVRGEIYEAGGGNPFFLQQLARQHAAGRAVAAEPAGAGVPRAVARALEQEIAALGEAGRLLAQGAAVAGDPVDLDLAAAAAELDEDGRRWTRWTSCSRARCWSAPTSRAATASGTRSCATRSTSPPPTAGGSPRTPASPPRWPRAAARSPPARTISSAARGRATTRRWRC